MLKWFLVWLSAGETKHLIRSNLKAQLYPERLSVQSRLLKSVMFIWVLKKITNCWIFLQSLVDFCATYEDVNAYPLLFIQMCCVGISSSRWVSQRCALIVCWHVRAGMTSAHERFFFCFVFCKQSKALFYGSSCNPSSGIYFFFLFKIRFRYLNKCCCSLFR